MRQSGGENGNAQSLLSLYAHGALPPDEVGAVKRHLADCPHCLGEHTHLNEITGLLALQSLDEVTAIHSQASSASAAPRSPSLIAGAGTGTPTESRDRRRTNRASRPGWRAVTAVAACAAAVAIGATMVITFRRDGPAVVEVAEVATTSAPGRSLNITVTERNPGLAIRAVVVGLHPGIEFYLVAVSRDGRSLPIFRGIAAGGPQTVVGELDVALEEIAFFTVAHVDGSLLMSARLSKGTP
jgi:anti-sigma factor RsiW